MVTYTKERTLKKPRPSLKKLGELIDQFCGNIPDLAEYLGYKRNQIYRWIQEAPDSLRDELLDKIAQGRATAQRAKLLRQTEFLSYIPPIDIKSLLSPFYRLPWDVLQDMEISDIIADMDEDAEKPKTLRKKLGWDDLRRELAGELPSYDPSGEPIAGTGCTGLESLTVTVEGVQYTGWHQHCLLSWVGLGAESALWEHHEHLPTVIDAVEEIDDHGRPFTRLVPFGPHIENTVRLLIKRLEKYL